MNFAISGSRCSQLPGVIQAGAWVHASKASEFHRLHAAGGLGGERDGTTKSTNNTRIDGASNAHIWLPQHSAYMPPLESIENVNIVTNSMDAEQGLAGGAAINVSMKSGTNTFHGVAFNYHQNSAFKAKNVFFTEAKIPKYIQNQYGGTLGGPIVKNKLFFFGSYERTSRRWNVSRFVTVPAADQREGNFSAYGTTLYDPLTGNPDGSGRSIFPNAIIPASRQSRVRRPCRPRPVLGADGTAPRRARGVMSRVCWALREWSCPPARSSRAW